MSGAALDIQHSTRLPAEFRGLARKYRAEVRETDLKFEHALTRVTQPLGDRLKRHPRLRHEQVSGTIADYRKSIPAGFRFGDIAVKPDRDEFRITETRLTATVMHNRDWVEEHPIPLEPGVAVARYYPKSDRGKLKSGWDALAIVSLHALGRYYERTGDRNPVNLTCSLGALAYEPSGDDAAILSDRVEIEAGYWIGNLVTMRGPQGMATCRAVRTWHA
jgi:hypothetical protein